MASGRPPRRQQQQANSSDGFTDSNVSAASSSVTTRRSPPPSSSSLAVEEAASAAVARAAEASTTPRILSSGGRSRTPPPRSLREGMIAAASTTTSQHDTLPSSSSGGGRRSSSSSGGGGRRRTMGTMRNNNSDNNNNNNNNDDNSGNDYDNSIMSAVAEVMANDNTTIQTSRTATLAKTTTTTLATTTTIPKKKKQRSLILLGSKPRGMYECDYCSTDLTRVPRIRCAICPDFDLCLDCFATEDHVHMAKYKREEESQRRKDEARHHQQQQQQQQQSKEEEKDEALGGGGVKDMVNLTPNKGGKLKRNDKQGTKKKGVVDDNDNDDDDEEEEIMALRDEDIGSYIHGKWVPYFQHESTHGYIVADSTRYVLFPPFRGVVPIVAAGELATAATATVATALPLGGGAELASAATENKDQEEMEDVATAIATSDDISGNKMTGINYHQEEQEEEKGEVALTSEELDTVSKQITFSSSSSSSALSSVAAPMETHNLNENNSEDTTPKHSNMFEIVDTTAATTTTTTTTTTTISAAASDNVNDDDDGDGGVHPFSQGIVIKDPVLLAEIVAAVTTTIDTINTNNNVNIDNDDDDEKATLDDDTMVVSQQVNDNNAKNSVASVVNTVIDGLNRSSIHNNSHKSSFRLQQQQQRKPHRYRLVDDINKAIWTTEEDLALLDGILTCGLGNWPTIAEHVNGGGAEGGSNGNGGGAEESGRGGSANYGSSSSSSSSSSNSGGKTDKQCMERYLDDFMGRYGCILPPYTMVPDDNDEEGGNSDGSITPPVVAAVAATSLAVAQDGPVGEVDGSARKRLRRNASSTFLDFDDTAPGFKRIKFQVIPTEELEEFKGLSYQPYIPPNMKMGDEVARDLWYRSEQYFVRQLTNATSKADADIIRKEFIERHKQGIPGYEARVLPPRLEDMKQLPGAELAGFMPRRGDFDIEWDNDAEKTIAEMEFSPDDTKADRELKLDVLRIFNTKLGEREKRRQFIIDHGLLNYRENQEKLWAMPPDERHLVQRMRLFARFQTRDEHEAFVNKILEAKRLRKEIAKLQMYRRMGITSLADIEKYEMDKVRCELHKEAWTKKEDENRKAADEAARAVRENADYVPSTNPVVPPFGKLDGPVGAEVNQSLQLWKQHMKPTKKEDECEGTKSNDNADTETSTATKFIIKDKPNYDLLSKKEVELCKRLRLLPQSYLDVKRALINEALAQGLWDPTTANNVQKQQQSRSIFKVDVTQCDNIIDFVLEAGWIPTRPSIIDDA